MTDSTEQSRALAPDLLRELTRELSHREIGNNPRMLAIGTAELRVILDALDNWTHPTARQDEEGGWRPIETAPEDGRQVLIVGGRYREAIITGADGHWWRWARTEGGLTGGATHWMPLPAPPTTEKSKP